MPDFEDDFDLVDQCDSIEDRELRSEFLDAAGRTRPFIDTLRRRRDAASNTPAPDGPASPAPRGESRRRAPRTRRRSRGVVTRPPNRGRVRRRYPRPRIVFVLVVESG